METRVARPRVDRMVQEDVEGTCKKAVAGTVVWGEISHSRPSIPSCW